MGFELTRRDLAFLKGVNPDLVKVFMRAAEISPIRFRIIEGLRSVKRQRQLVAKGASKTMNSRHLTGHAVDAIPLVDKNNDGKISSSEMWDWPAYYQLAKYIKQAAKELGIPLEWGGDWKRFKDGPHWQLPWASYPKIASLMGTATTAYSELESEDVTSAPPYTGETDSEAAVKSVAAATSGVGVGGAIAAEPLANALDAITTQQYELTSGDYLRIGIALVIVVGAAYVAYQKAK